MAIKFDELLEALDPALDEFEEDLNSMWIIIPTERRYDDLTADGELSIKVGEEYKLYVSPFFPSDYRFESKAVMGVALLFLFLYLISLLLIPISFNGLKLFLIPFLIKTGLWPLNGTPSMNSPPAYE